MNLFPHGSLFVSLCLSGEPTSHRRVNKTIAVDEEGPRPPRVHQSQPACSDLPAPSPLVSSPEKQKNQHEIFLTVNNQDAAPGGVGRLEPAGGLGLDSGFMFETGAPVGLMAA